MKKRFNKKRTAWVLIAFFIGFVFAPANYAAAYTATNAADELANIYKYIDENDKDSIRAAKTEALALSDTELDGLTNDLVAALPEEFLDQYPGDLQAELRDCFRDLVLIVYDENTVEDDLTEYKNNHKDTFQNLFGTSFTVDLYELILALREELPRVIYNNSDYIQVVESGSDPELITQIPNIAKDAANNVLTKTEYEDFADKLDEIGWTTEMLMDTYIAFCDDIDDANSSAELAMAKAAVRSQIYLYLCDPDENIIEEISADELAQREVTVQQPAYFQAYIGSQNFASPNANANVTTWFLWNSSNTQISINDSYPSGQGTTLELAGGSVGDTGTITGYRDAGTNGDPVADWLVKFDVAVAGEGVAVDGTITSWDDINDDAIVNLYDPTYSDADIRADMENGTPVNAIENVATLGTPTYDSVSKRYNQSFSFADVSAGDYKVAIYKTGKYVVKVATISIGATNINAGALKLWLYGDVNDDGIINSSDHQRLFEHLNGTNLLTGDALLAGDVNKDENTNSSDHQRLFEHLNGTNPLS